MRQYASTRLKNYNKMKIPTGHEQKGMDIVSCTATEIPMQMMWGAEMHSFSNLVHYVYLSEFLKHDQ